MVKIKIKKEMNLPELIKWGWENLEQVRGKDFKSNVIDVFNHQSSLVQFSVDGYGFKTDGVSYKDTFEVEIEEEITEDTVIPKMLVIYYKNAAHIQTNKSLNFLIKDNLKSVYILNDDLTMTLIWTKEKGLVE
ncbi:hypothetical protein [Mammaliicoccus sciuri]|uniref:hypothetical protein n=1 Tax=Mammaliicoccus sciuri TaxID=1296 RepID=UPI0021D34889|nr:hypothetical protein [Mammaliicoccus sciuri]UXU70217.1 hypothetical protein MUA36_05910 [Mammaliicoccus sciuri]